MKEGVGFGELALMGKTKNEQTRAASIKCN